jgi:hypothetical protein
MYGKPKLPSALLQKIKKCTIYSSSSPMNKREMSLRSVMIYFMLIYSSIIHRFGAFIYDDWVLIVIIIFQDAHTSLSILLAISLFFYHYKYYLLFTIAVMSTLGAKMSRNSHTTLATSI